MGIHCLHYVCVYLHWFALFTLVRLFKTRASTSSSGRAWDTANKQPTGWHFMSEIGLAHAGNNEASRQNNKGNAWFYCFYQKCYFFRSDSLTHWLIDSFDSKNIRSLVNDTKQSVQWFAVVCNKVQLQVGHRFHSLRLLELFSCAFITNSQEWRLYWRIMRLTILRKMFPFPLEARKSLNTSLERDTAG